MMLSKHLQESILFSPALLCHLVQATTISHLLFCNSLLTVSLTPRVCEPKSIHFTSLRVTVQWYKPDHVPPTRTPVHPLAAPHSCEDALAKVRSLNSLPWDKMTAAWSWPISPVICFIMEALLNLLTDLASGQTDQDRHKVT